MSIIQTVSLYKKYFLGKLKRMKSAYYTNKISQYLKDIAKGKRKVASWWEIKAEMAKITKKYNVSAIAAFNAKFDWLATRNTSIYLSKGKIAGFLPFVEMWDIQLMSVVIADTKTYQRFCQEHRYLTKTGLPSVKVEVLYRYLNNDIALIESHTGLEDCFVEKDILVECLKKHKKMRKKLFLKST